MNDPDNTVLMITPFGGIEKRKDEWVKKVK
jgi:hypothetical protein